MSIVIVGSVRGSPGATTAALLVAGYLDAVLVDADLDGGVLAVRYGLGREPGLTTLAAARSNDPLDWRHHAQAAGGVPVLVGPDAPTNASSLWERAGTHLAAALRAAELDVVVDAGRLRQGPVLRSLLPITDLVVIVTRPLPEDLVTLAHRLPDLRQSRATIGIALAGTGPYSAEAVADQIDADVLAELPHDPRATEMLSTRGGSARALVRSPLARAARSLADSIAGRIEAVPARQGGEQ